MAQSPATCRLAGVKPRYETLNGQDPVVYIVSSNINRRHLNKGQRAILIAKVRRLDSNQSVRVAARESGLSHSHVAQAGVILQYAPDQAEGPLVGPDPIQSSCSPALPGAKKQGFVIDRACAVDAGLFCPAPRGWWIRSRSRK